MIKVYPIEIITESNVSDAGRVKEGKGRIETRGEDEVSGRRRKEGTLRKEFE